MSLKFQMIIFRKISTFLSVILLILYSIPSASANQCGPYFDNFTSPICTDAKYIFWTGSAITLGMYALKDSFVKEIQDRTVQKNHLKNWGVVGGDIGFGYLNGAYFLFNMLRGQRGQEKAEHMLEASIYTLGTTQALKYGIHESRPGFPQDPDSFPSGHASFSFAFASVVTAQDGWAWGSLAYLMASFISFSRMDENWHYLHDVVFGATLGASYGWGIYLNHQEHNKPYWLSLVPSVSKGHYAVNVVYSF